VDKQLLEKAKRKYPAAKGLDVTALVDFLIRKALEAD